MEHKLSTSAALPESLSSSFHFSEHSMSETSPTRSKPVETQNNLQSTQGSHNAINVITNSKVNAKVGTNDHNDKMMDAELFSHVRSGVLSVLDQHENANKLKVSSLQRDSQPSPSQPQVLSAEEAVGTQQITTVRDRSPVNLRGNANNSQQIVTKESVEDAGEFCNNESIAFDVLTENSIDFESDNAESVKHGSTKIADQNDVHDAIQNKDSNDNIVLRSRESSETRRNSLEFVQPLNSNYYMSQSTSDSGSRKDWSTTWPPIPFHLLKETQHRNAINNIGDVIQLKHIPMKEGNKQGMMRALHGNKKYMKSHYISKEDQRRGNTGLLDDHPAFRKQLEKINLDDEQYTPEQRLRLQIEKEKLRIWEEQENEKMRLRREKILEQQQKRQELLEQQARDAEQREREENHSVQTDHTESENNSTSQKKKTLSTKFNKLLGKIHCAPVGSKSAQDYEHYLNNSIAADSHRSSVSGAQSESQHTSGQSLQSLQSGQANQSPQEANNANSTSMNEANNNTVANNNSNNNNSNSQESTSTNNNKKKKRTIAGEIVHYFHKRSQKKKDKKAEKLRKKEMERTSQQNSIVNITTITTTTTTANNNKDATMSSVNVATTAVVQVEKKEETASETLVKKEEATQMQQEQKDHSAEMEEEQEKSTTSKLPASVNTNTVDEKSNEDAKQHIDSATITFPANQKEMLLETEQQSAREMQQELVSTSEEMKVRQTNAESTQEAHNINAYVEQTVNDNKKSDNINNNVEEKTQTAMLPHAPIASSHEQRQSQPTITLMLDESNKANSDLDVDDDNNNFSYEVDEVNNGGASKQDTNKDNIVNKDHTKLNSVETADSKNPSNSFDIDDSSSKVAHQKDKAAKNETAAKALNSHYFVDANVQPESAGSQSEKYEEQSQYSYEQSEESTYEEEKLQEEEHGHHSHVHFDTANETIKEEKKVDHVLRKENTKVIHDVDERNIDSKHDGEKVNAFRNNDAKNDKLKVKEMERNSSSKNKYSKSENRNAGSSEIKNEQNEETLINKAAIANAHDQNNLLRHSLTFESTSTNTSITPTKEEIKHEKVKSHKKRNDGNENEKSQESSTEVESQTSERNTQNDSEKIHDMSHDDEQQEKEKKNSLQNGTTYRDKTTQNFKNTHFLKVGQKVEETLQKDKRYRLLQKHELTLQDEIAQLDNKLQQVSTSSPWLGEYYRKMSAVEHKTNSQTEQKGNKMGFNNNNEKSVHASKNGYIRKKIMQGVNTRDKEQNLQSANKSLSLHETNNRKFTRATSTGQLSWSDTSLLQRMQRQQSNRTKRLTWEENTYYTKQRKDNKWQKEEMLGDKDGLMGEHDHEKYNLNGKVVSSDLTPLEQNSLREKQNGAKLTMEEIHHFMHKMYYCNNSDSAKELKERRRSETSDLLSTLTQQAKEKSITSTNNLQYAAHSTKKLNVAQHVGENAQEHHKDVVDINASNLLNNIDEYKIRPSCAACVPQSVTELTALAAYMTLTERLKEWEDKSKLEEEYEHLQNNQINMSEHNGVQNGSSGNVGVEDHKYNDEKTYQQLIRSLLEMEPSLLSSTTTSPTLTNTKTSLAQITNSNIPLVHPPIQLTQHIREEFYGPRPTKRAKQIHRNREEEESLEMLPNETHHENEHEQMESKQASISRSLSSSTGPTSSSLIARELRIKAIQMLEQLIEENNEANVQHHTTSLIDKHTGMTAKNTFCDDDSNNDNICNVEDDDNLEYSSENKMYHKPVSTEDDNNNNNNKKGQTDYHNNVANILDELFSNANSEININHNNSNNGDTHCDTDQCVE